MAVISNSVAKASLRVDSESLWYSMSFKVQQLPLYVSAVGGRYVLFLESVR